MAITTLRKDRIRWILYPITLIIVTALIAPQESSGQNRATEKIIEEYLDATSEIGRSKAALDLTTETLLSIADKPIVINRATEEELSQIPFLSQKQIRAILDYIDQYGGFYSKSELLAIKEIGRETFEQLSPFITIYSGETPTKRTRYYGKHEIIGKWENRYPKAEGYSDEFEGSSNRYFFRVKGNIERFTYGFVTEKDPGESSFSKTNPLLDYQTGYINYTNREESVDIIGGSYYLNIGQGLQFSNGTMSSKSSQVIPKVKSSSRIRGYISTDENRFLLGLSTSIKLNSWNYIVAISQKRRDANITDSGFFTSIQNSGYHRTESEIEDKNSLKETQVVASASRSFTDIKGTLTYSYGKYNKPKTPYNSIDTLHTFKGESFSNLGGSYTANIDGIQLYGEAVLSQANSNSNFALMQGVNSRISDRINGAVVARSYGRGYYAPYSNAFSEGGTSNENGVYLALEIATLPGLDISTYFDIFKRPWKLERIGAWNRGNETLVEMKYKPNKRWKLYYRLKYENKWINRNGIDDTIDTKRQLRGQNRVNIEYNRSSQLRLMARFEHALYSCDTVTDRGHLIYLDARYKGKKISLSARVAYFNTDSYNSRVYMYENDMLYQYSNPSFYEEGIRTYLNGKYTPTSKLSIYAKFGYRVQHGVTEIGSGSDKTIGDSRSELKIMARLKL